MLVKFLFLLLMFLVRYVLCGSQYFLETSLKSCPEAQSKLRIMENVVGKSELVYNNFTKSQ